MTHYSTTTLEPVRPPNVVEHDGRWWDTRPDAPDRDAHLAAVGIVALVTTEPPTITANEVAERSIALVSGVPTVVYTVRPKTAEELAADVAAQADQTDRDAARQAVATLRTYIDTPNPTAAQTVGVVKLLCRVAVRLVRDAYA